MDERAAFEAAIKADRYDQTTRRVFADWLDEHDRPEEADFQRRWTAEWQRAVDNLKSFCKRNNLNYEHLLKSAALCLDDQDWTIDVSLYTSNSTVDEDMRAMWADVAVVLRREDDGRSDDPFNCGGNCFPNGVDWQEEDDD